jgi:hypothetical protein
MNQTPSSTFSEVLHHLESRQDSFDTTDARDAIQAYAKAHAERSPEEDASVKAELVVLDLLASHAQESSSWGTHFGPMMVTRKGEYPPLAAVTPQMIAYCKIRAQVCIHPRLRARYADVTWDLEPMVNGGKRDAQFARIAIDAYIADCGLAGIELRQVEGLERALCLALKLDDEARVCAVRDTILSFQKKVASPDKPRLVLFHFDALYDQRKKVKLGNAQLAEMIDGLERQLTEWSDPTAKCFDPWSARELGQRLIRHYRATNHPEDAKRVVQVYAKGKLHLVGQANGMLAHQWLEELHQDYLDAGMRTEADALVPAIKQAGERMAGEMRPVEVSYQVSGEEMEQFCQEITEGGPQTAFGRIAVHFAPDAEHLLNEMHAIAAQHPLMSMMAMTISDEFTRARIGGVLDDEAGRLVMHMHQNLAFESPFLHEAISRLFSRYGLTADQLVDLICGSQLFEVERKPLLLTGIKHYLASDHASCAHIFIPQIEHLLRVLLRNLGGITVSLDSESKSYREKDLGTILRDPLMEHFWKQLAKRDIALYLRVALTDQRGLNVRNRVCHGLCEADWFTPQITDRLLHILMLLGLLRIEKQDRDESEATGSSSPTDML